MKTLQFYCAHMVPWCLHKFCSVQLTSPWRRYSFCQFWHVVLWKKRDWNVSEPGVQNGRESGFWKGTISPISNYCVNYVMSLMIGAITCEWTYTYLLALVTPHIIKKDNCRLLNSNWGTKWNGRRRYRPHATFYTTFCLRSSKTLQLSMPSWLSFR